MYDIVCWRDSNKESQHIILYSNISTLSDCLRLRELSGDLVVFHNTFNVVKSLSWLFEWERRDPNSYAHRYVLKSNTTVIEELEELFPTIL